MENRLSQLKNTTIYTCFQHKCVYISSTCDIIQKERQKMAQGNNGSSTQENPTPEKHF